MAGPNATKRPQGNRTRPMSVAVAVPLNYGKKRSQKAATPGKNQSNITTTKVVDASSPATTSEPFYPPAIASTRTTNGDSSPPGDGHTLKSEHLEVSLSSQENSNQQHGVLSSWASNAQSTCIIEYDQGNTHMLFTFCS